jgi:MFS family permease
MSAVSERPLAVVAPAVPTWRWVHVGVAALAMAATLPGRTHGLGIITEPLLNALNLDRVSYADINLWATLLGAAFCIPCGWLIDRLGTRLMLALVACSLGAVVVLLSQVERTWVVTLPEWLVALHFFHRPTLLINLFLLVLLTRGLGQSALSVASLALVGQAAGRRSGPAIAVYSVLVALGFSAALTALKYALEQDHADWRTVWAGIGWTLVGFAILVCFLVRPGISGWSVPQPRDGTPSTASLNLGQALGTPAFWVFSLAISFYGLIAAGISLFNQSILEERGFDRSVFLTIAAVSPLLVLTANLATGWLATRWALGRLLGVAMFILSLALVSFPFVSTLVEVYLYAAAMSIAGGMITVLFFAVWGQSYGPVHLGKIQGAAQMMTVFASALGPLLLALAKENYDSYLPLFYGAALATGLFALIAWFTPLPALPAENSP